jgi:acyl-coenzyme A synthetase/AMP-(fatty) acid ligase
VLHTTGGYLVYAAMTHQYVFDCHEGDIYWCTADVGWVAGHRSSSDDFEIGSSYIVSKEPK